MAGITKQMAIPFFVQFFITFQSIYNQFSALFQLPHYLYIEGKNNPPLDFLPSTYYIYNEGNKSTK